MNPMVPTGHTLDGFPRGSQAEVVLPDGRRVLLIHGSSGVCAVQAQCSHMGKPLMGGLVRGDTLHCPHHAAKFDLRSGRSLAPLPTSQGLKTWTVHIEAGRILLEAATSE